jgi:putative flippase GtrA
MTAADWRRTGLRWLKFNAVGGVGIGVQLAALAVLKGWLHLDYLLATALAVEAAVLHNFLWHEHYTWADRARTGGTFVRLAKFNLTTGALSILGNLVLMTLLVGAVHLQYLLANAITIAACSLVNFVVSDRFVFASLLKPGSNC